MRDTEIKEGKVTIIVPIYNGEKYLPRCIESILRQTYQDIELLLIDDGSTDGTANICEQYARQDPRVIVKKQTNQGVSSARNSGILSASGQYITFADADDEMCDNAIETAVRCLHQAKADVVTYGWVRCDEKGDLEEPISEEYEILTDPEAILHRMLEHYSSCGGGYPWNKLWRTASFQSICLFDPKLYFFEDMEWCVRMILKVKKLVICPECLYRYSVLQSSVSNQKEQREKRETGYHQAMKQIISVLKDHPQCASWLEKKYYPEIVNGILFSVEKKYWCVYRQLMDRFIQIKKKIKSACYYSRKMRIRYAVISLLSYVRRIKRVARREE